MDKMSKSLADYIKRVDLYLTLLQNLLAEGSYRKEFDAEETADLEDIEKDLEHLIKITQILNKHSKDDK